MNFEMAKEGLDVFIDRVLGNLEGVSDDFSGLAIENGKKNGSLAMGEIAHRVSGEIAVGFDGVKQSDVAED